MPAYVGGDPGDDDEGYRGWALCRVTDDVYDGDHDDALEDFPLCCGV